MVLTFEAAYHYCTARFGHQFPFNASQQMPNAFVFRSKTACWYIYYRPHRVQEAYSENRYLTASMRLKVVLGCKAGLRRLVIPYYFPPRVPTHNTFPNAPPSSKFHLFLPHHHSKNLSLLLPSHKHSTLKSSPTQSHPAALTRLSSFPNTNASGGPITGHQ
jgi:hypothetical protein